LSKGNIETSGWEKLNAASARRRDAHKNWRFNCQFVHDSDGQLGRYDNMEPGDLAVLHFTSDPEPQKR